MKIMKKKRYYEEGVVFSIGRGQFIAHEADGKYWVKEPTSPGSYCYSCCFRMNRGKGSCAILACSPNDRFDKKNVIFEKI